MVTTLSNPKALVFFGAVFAQFIRLDMSPTWTVAVAVILVAMSVTWFSTFTLIARGIALDCASFRGHRYRFGSYLCGAGTRYGRGGHHRALWLVQVADFYKRVDIGAT